MIRVFVVIGIGIVLGFLLLDYLYKKTNDYKNQRIDIRAFDEGMQDELQIVNLGSTYSKYAFGASRKLQLKWGDFSLQSQSLEMDYSILKKNVDKIVPNGVVVVVAAACLMLYKETKPNYLYYEILKKNENPEYSLMQKVKSKVPLLNRPKRAISIFLDKFPYTSVYDNYPNMLSKEQSEDELLDLVNVWKKLFGLKDMKSVELSDNIMNNIQYNQKMLNKIFDCCFEHNLQPVVVVPPFSERLNNFFSDEFEDTVINQKIKECINGREILYLNYQNDDYFQQRTELFCDGGFRLNERGSNIFIRRVLADLEMEGYKLDNLLVKC